MHPFHKSAEEELGDLSRSSVLELVAEIEWHKAAHQESIRHLLAEIERLRAALTDIRGLSIGDPDDPLPTIYGIAVKALGANEQNEVSNGEKTEG